MSPLTLQRSCRERQHGDSLIEVLVALVIIMFGLLGLAGLQMKTSLTSVESYQRAQAVVLLSDLSERMKANRSQAPNYVTASALGTGDTQPADCSAKAAGSADRDECEWSNALKGAAETQGTTNVGAMIGTRGCVNKKQDPDPTPGVCRPGIYEVSVVWQGHFPTVTPPAAVTCGQGQYGDEKERRAIVERVSVGLLSCK